MSVICDGRFHIDLDGDDVITIEDAAADNAIFVPISCVEPLVEYLQHLRWLALQKAYQATQAQRTLPRPAMLEEGDELE